MQDTHGDLTFDFRKDLSPKFLLPLQDAITKTRAAHHRARPETFNNLQSVVNFSGGLRREQWAAGTIFVTP
jgi:hypothetical protein